MKSFLGNFSRHLATFYWSHFLSPDILWEKVFIPEMVLPGLFKIEGMQTRLHPDHHHHHGPTSSDELIEDNFNAMFKAKVYFARLIEEK